MGEWTFYHSILELELLLVVKLLSLRGDLESWSFGGGADFLAQQTMLCCATNDAVLRNKGVGGCARRLMGRRKLQGKKCAPLA